MFGISRPVGLKCTNFFRNTDLHHSLGGAGKKGETIVLGLLRRGNFKTEKGARPGNVSMERAHRYRFFPFTV